MTEKLHKTVVNHFYQMYVPLILNFQHRYKLLTQITCEILCKSKALDNIFAIDTTATIDLLLARATFVGCLYSLPRSRLFWNILEHYRRNSKSKTVNN